jgi:hypothetical protein
VGRALGKDGMTMRYLLSALLVLILAAPAAAQNTPLGVLTLRTSSTATDSLKVGCASNSSTCTGGILAGRLSVNGVVIVGTDGRIPAISSTYFASLSGANLTGIVETAITDGTLLARVADAETVSGSWTFSSGLTTLSNAAPILKWVETDAAADAKRWLLYANGGALTLETRNDAESASNPVFSVARSGATVGAMTVGASTIQVQAGSSSAPAIANAANTDVGMYFGANDIRFSVNNTQVALLSQTSSAVSAGQITFNAGNVGGTGFLFGVSGGGDTVMAITAANGPAVATMDRGGTDGTIIDFLDATVSVGSISLAGTTVAYNTFMGAHYTQLMPGQDAPEVGTVVVSAGKAIPVLPRKLTRGLVDAAPGEVAWVDDAVAPRDPAAERFVYVEPSSKRNQKGVYGVWFADLGRSAAGMSWGDPDAEVYQVASVGLYQVWVTDTCGPIRTGDWLATSPLEGLAERQCTVSQGGKPGYDPVNRDYTLGKALVDVDFSKVAPDADGIRKVLVPFHFAN